MRGILYFDKLLILIHMYIYIYMFWRRHELTTTSLPIYVFRVNNVPHYPSKYLYKNHELTANRLPVNRRHGFYRISGIRLLPEQINTFVTDDRHRRIIASMLIVRLRIRVLPTRTRNRFAYREGKFYSERVPFRTTTHASLYRMLNGFLARHGPRYEWTIC